MPAQQNHWVATVYLAESADGVAVGDVVVLNSAGTGYVVATSANRASASRDSAGIALTAADDDNRAFEMQVVGVVASTVTGLGSGTASAINVSSTGRLQRCDNDDDDIVGKCDADGTAYVDFAIPWDAVVALAGGGGGGGTPGGSDTQLQRNNAGAFGGISGATSDGTNTTFSDSTLFVADNSDPTKRVQLQVSGVTTATTRTLTVPDADFTIAGTTIARGGTGATSIASGLVSSNGTALSGGATVNLTSQVTGTLPFGNGGTGSTSIASGLVRSNGTVLSGGAKVVSSDIDINTISVDRLSGGSNGTYLRWDSGTPTWLALGATGNAAEIQINNGSNVMTAATGVTAGSGWIGIAAGATIPTSGQFRTGLGNAVTGALIRGKASTGDANLLECTSSNTWKLFHEDSWNANLYAAALNIWGKTSLIIFGTGAGAAEIARTGSDLWQWTATKIQATGNARIKAYGDLANVQTTDATVTSVFTWSIVDEAVTFPVASVTACRSTGADTAVYVRRTDIKRDGGTVTVGSIEDNFTRESVAGWDCTIDNSTSTGRVRVTGASSTTIDWGCNMHREETTHA